jgi:hypothetical protein
MSSEATAVARTKPALPAAYAEDIQRRKERNAISTAIRGTQWGKEVSQDTVRAVSEYAYRTGIDPVRHIEVLGGRIYLNADYYREKGAPLIKAGVVRATEIQHIAADARLDAMAEKPGPLQEWAAGERDTRIMLRIKYGVPEGAKAAAICRITMADGSVLDGVNWVGGSSKRDPVGDSEPTKTAESRAERRAWRRLVEVQPALLPDAAKAESVASEINESIPDAEVTPHGELPVRPAVRPLMIADVGDDTARAPEVVSFLSEAQLELAEKLLKSTVWSDAERAEFREDFTRTQSGARVAFDRLIKDTKARKEARKPESLRPIPGDEVEEEYQDDSELAS